MDTLNTPLGDLARTHPSYTQVFLRHRLDFCCGGRRTLDEACAIAGLDARVIEDELAALEAGPDEAASWEARPLSDLADHIEHHFHAGLRRDLPPLVEAARKIERVHHGKPSVPIGLGDRLESFWTEMQSHMRKEEMVLFPMIRRGARGEAVFMPVSMLEHEHDTHRDHLVAIRDLTDDLRVPAHGCATWTALYRGLGKMEEDLMEHIHLENNMLFLRAARG